MEFPFNTYISDIFHPLAQRRQFDSFHITGFVSFAFSPALAATRFLWKWRSNIFSDESGVLSCWFQHVLMVSLTNQIIPSYNWVLSTRELQGSKQTLRRAEEPAVLSVICSIGRICVTARHSNCLFRCIFIKIWLHIHSIAETLRDYTICRWKIYSIKPFSGIFVKNMGNKSSTSVMRGRVDDSAAVAPLDHFD